MNQANELIKRIGLILVESVPVKDWQEIVFEASVLVGHAEFKTYFKHGTTSKTFAPELILERGRKEFPETHAVKLRQTMYDLSPEKGSWFLMRMVIKPDGDFDIHFDYETKPVFGINMDDSDFIEDYQKYPRKEEILPRWLFDILSRNRIV